MKRLLLITMCCVLGMLNASAQSSGLSQKELQFRNGIERYLKDEGFRPTIDNDDNSLNWKIEGASYWLTVRGSDPYYITLHLGGFNTEDTNLSIIYEACNYANRNKRCGKACYDDGSVVFTVEYYCQSLANFRDTFYKYTSSIESTKSAVKTYYNEHDN